MAGLKVVKHKVVDLGSQIDSSMAKAIKQRHVDVEAKGSSNEDVNRFVGKEIRIGGRPHYSGTIVWISGICGFIVKLIKEA